MKRKNTTTLVKNPQYNKKPKSQQQSLVNPSPKLNMLHVEKKNVDAQFGLTLPAYGTWSAGQLLNGLAPGSSPITRIGRKTQMKSIQIRSSNQSVGGTAAQMTRILCVYDKQTNAAAPTITDILLLNQPESPMNLSNSDRFVILFDQMTEQDQIPGASVHFNQPTYRKIGLETMYNTGVAGTVADIASGSVYIFVAGNGTIGTNTCNIISRIRFTDV